MAYDIFLKIDGIDGESMDDKHKNEIEVLSWRWNIHQESTMHAGSGLGSGKVSVTNLDFDHYIDRASPNLFKYCASGKHIPQAILVMRKAGGNPLEYWDTVPAGQKVGRFTGDMMITVTKKMCSGDRHTSLPLTANLLRLVQRTALIWLA